MRHEAQSTHAARGQRTLHVDRRLLEQLQTEALGGARRAVVVGRRHTADAAAAGAAAAIAEGFTSATT